MEALLLGLAALACPVGMGVMMWVTMRGQRGKNAEASTPMGSPEQARRIGELQEDVRELRKS